MSLNNNNPYNDLLGLMRTQGKYHNPLVPIVGKITKVNDALSDIEVITHTMPLYKDDLLIDSWLLDRHTKQFIDHTEGSHIHGGDITGEGLHKHEMKEPLVDKLKVNDLVLLVSHEEKFIIVSKVVSI
jgi:hypothetical protein